MHHRDLRLNSRLVLLRQRSRPRREGAEEEVLQERAGARDSEPVMLGADEEDIQREAVRPVEQARAEREQRKASEAIEEGEIAGDEGS